VRVSVNLFDFLAAVAPLFFPFPALSSPLPAPSLLSQPVTPPLTAPKLCSLTLPPLSPTSPLLLPLPLPRSAYASSLEELCAAAAPRNILYWGDVLSQADGVVLRYCGCSARQRLREVSIHGPVSVLIVAHV
jgi:hypothetical protein